QRHGRVVLAHQLAVKLAEPRQAFDVLLLAGHENGHAPDAVHAAAGLLDAALDVQQRLAELVGEVVALEALVFVPADHAGNEQRPALRQHHGVGVALGPLPARRVDDLRASAHQCSISPPSMLSAWPVMPCDSSASRKATVCATSAGSNTRYWGLSFFSLSSAWTSSRPVLS